MKKIIWGLILLLGMAPAFAGEKKPREDSGKSSVTAKKPSKPAPKSKTETPVPDSEGTLYWGLGAALSLPAQNFNPALDLGWGGRLMAGVVLDKSLSLQLAVDNFSFSAAGTSVYDLRLIPQLKALADMGGSQLFLVAGPGIDFEFAQGVSADSLDLMFGPGVQFALGGRSYLFLEWDFNFILADGVTGMDVPLVAGLNFPL